VPHETEYVALREEIQNRTKAQHTFINLNLTAVTAVAGFALKDNRETLLVLPVICPVLGLLWLDQARMIDVLGRYLEHEFGPLGFKWEAKSVTHTYKRWGWRLLWFGFPTASVFILAPLVGEFSYWTGPGKTFGLDVVAGLALGLTLATAFAWWLWINPKTNERLRSHATQDTGPSP
jgi:hypothetical protein